MRLDDLTLKELLDSLGAKTPTPGGGAVAAVVSALGAALGQMVLRFSQGRKSLAAHDALHRDSLAALERHVKSSLDSAEADARAYGRLNELWKLDKADPARVAAWPDAVNAAIEAPRLLLHDCLSMLTTLRELTGRTNRMLDSDLAIAAILAEAAARSAAWSVRINLPLLEDAVRAKALRLEIERCLAEAHQMREQIERVGAARPQS